MPPTPKQIAELADIFSRCRYDPDATVAYDMLSGGPHWTDEHAPSDASFERWTLIRFLWNHRGALIIGAPSKHEELWNAGLQAFPTWPGFRPERSTPEGLDNDKILKRLKGDYRRSRR
ncbi:MAG: hypothetical protein AAF747_04715 [Planctomycetota bacterium]